MWKVIEITIFVIFAVLAASSVSGGPFKWMKHDAFDVVMDKFTAATADNCRSKPAEDLVLPKHSVMQLPRYNKLLSSILYSNRSSLLHLHNMALNRAFYFSYIYQKLNKSDENDTLNFQNQPGLSYVYFSVAADISANAGYINGSGVMFDFNCSYPNWLKTLPFNTTIPFFGPKSWRKDDYNEPTNWLREPTNNTINVWDLGAGRTRDYTHNHYKGNPWYKDWDMPDTWEKEPFDSMRKYTYTVRTKTSNETGKFLKDEYDGDDFFGPPQPGQFETETLPVRWTTPYFDCGRSNRWIITASSPVVEYMRRYVQFKHLRRPQYVAIATMDIEFERIDFNPCPVSEGNPLEYDPPGNLLAGTARCKSTTMCEPLPGYGFRRGGYHCVCRAGYYYPWYQDGPFLGEEIEQATEEEYGAGFDCLAIDERQVLPNEAPVIVYGTEARKKRSTESTLGRFIRALTPGNQTPSRKLIRKLVAKRSTKSVKKVRFVPRYKHETAHIRHKREGAFDDGAYERVKDIMDRKYTTKKDNCHQIPSHKLLLPGDVTFGVKHQFEAQGRTALRVAHFLSNFLQNVDEYEEFGNIRGDRRLNETQLFAEVVANVMSDFKVLGNGIFFDDYKFRMSPPINNTDPRYVNGITREFFGPYAWRVKSAEVGLDDFRALDFAGFKSRYVEEDWFKNMKYRWASSVHGLKKFTVNPMIRSDIDGTSRIRFEHYPIKYFAAQYEDGEWLQPKFICDQEIQIYEWVVPYIVPFFGLNLLKTHLEFKGIIKIDVKLDYLDINQCPQPFDIANAFKNTARCHFQTTYCTPLEGNRFKMGGYKCECRQGYEYIFIDQAWYYDGQTMELEYEKWKSGNADNRYETLKCRIAGASSILANSLLVMVVTVIAVFHNQQ